MRVPSGDHSKLVTPSSTDVSGCGGVCAPSATAPASIAHGMSTRLIAFLPAGPKGPALRCHEHDFPDVAARLDEAVRVGCPLERKRFRDDRFQAPGGELAD